MGVRSYRDLIAWQKALDLAVGIYSLSKNFPADERFGLTTQLRRSASSVPSIAEGEGRFSKPDFARFLSIAYGSLCEAETQIILAERLGYLPSDGIGGALEQAREVGRLIRGFARSLDAHPPD